MKFLYDYTFTLKGNIPDKDGQLVDVFYTYVVKADCMFEAEAKAEKQVTENMITAAQHKRNELWSVYHVEYINRNDFESGKPVYCFGN